MQSDQCDLKTNSQQEFNVHEGGHYIEQQKPVAKHEESNDVKNEIEHFMCDHCEYGTYWKHGLAVHLGIRHKEKQKPDFFRAISCQRSEKKGQRQKVIFFMKCEG